ncbi:MAG: SDR family oxidoreductase [Trueperaceae bacterium]|nr:MAG: SDR family oxidoreductase [Trueperaceae bacterium]
MDLTGKVALITGGSKGIGFGIAEALVTAGMNVCITARHKDELEKATARLNRQGNGKALGIPTDVRSFEAQKRAVADTISTFSQLDVLIANAGVGHFGSVETLSLEAWQEVLETNLTGVFLSVKAAVEELKKTRGYIITIGSLAGTNFFAGGSAYNASKFGLTGFSQAMMLDLRPYGIRVTTIMPGSVATSFSGTNPTETERWKIQPEDLGEMVLYLLRSPAGTLASKVEVRPSQPPSR